MSLLELLCTVDDFWQAFAPVWQQKLLTSGQRQRVRARELSESEMMTIVIHFHQARYRDFKTYYTQSPLWSNACGASSLATKATSPKR